MLSIQTINQYIAKGLLDQKHTALIADHECSFYFDPEVYSLCASQGTVGVLVDISLAGRIVTYTVVFKLEPSNLHYGQEASNLLSILWAEAEKNLLVPSAVLGHEVEKVRYPTGEYCILYYYFLLEAGVYMNFAPEVFLLLTRSTICLSSNIVSMVKRLVRVPDVLLIDTKSFFGFSFMFENEIYSIGFVSGDNGLTFTHIDTYHPLMKDLVTLSADFYRV